MGELRGKNLPDSMPVNPESLPANEVILLG